jgi:hypothetical protein
MDLRWNHWLERLYNLRRDKTGSHERPHKPALLVSIMDLLDRGALTRNEEPLDEDLIKTFKRCFAVARQHNDQPTIQNPYFHLCGDKFWQLGRHRETSGARSVTELRRPMSLTAATSSARNSKMAAGFTKLRFPKTLATPKLGTTGCLKNGLNQSKSFWLPWFSRPVSNGSTPAVISSTE